MSYLSESLLILLIGLSTVEQFHSVMKKWISWNKNVTHAFKDCLSPDTEAAFAQAIKEVDSIRAFGTKQSTADIAAGTDTLLSVEKYDHVLNINKAALEITAQSGIILSDLLNEIDALGWSLPALPDIDSVTLGGAISTGTHGTGKEAHILSEYMVSCRLIQADGNILAIDEHSGLMPAVRVSLGCLGFISEITMRCVPKFSLSLEQKPIKDEDWLPSVIDDFNTTDFLRILWLPHTNFAYVIKGVQSDKPLEALVNEEPSYISHRREVSRLFYDYTVQDPAFTPQANQMIKELFFSHRTTNFGALYEATVTKSRASALELGEWIIPAAQFQSFFLDFKKALHDDETDAFGHIPMDIRFLKADSTWLSYAFETDVVTIGCVSRTPDFADRHAAFDLIEKIARQYGGRPHFGKRHNFTKKDFENIYPKWNDFAALRKKMDPEGKFLTDYFRSRMFG